MFFFIFLVQIYYKISRNEKKKVSKIDFNKKLKSTNMLMQPSFGGNVKRPAPTSAKAAHANATKAEYNNDMHHHNGSTPDCCGDDCSSHVDSGADEYGCSHDDMDRQHTCKW